MEYHGIQAALSHSARVTRVPSADVNLDSIMHASLGGFLAKNLGDLGDGFVRVYLAVSDETGHRDRMESTMCSPVHAGVAGGQVRRIERTNDILEQGG